MAHGDKDSRVGSGYMRSGSVRMPTITIPCDCSCTWVVVRSGPGAEAISEAKYLNSLCPRLREHHAMATAVVPVVRTLEAWVAGGD